MSDTPFATLTLTSPEETATLAARMSGLLGGGDVILLHGPIGSGKTHFARSLIQTLLNEHGVLEDVPSPTFTIVQTYEAGDLDIWHADLYRLGHPDDVIELGLADAFEEALCLIEWPDRLGEFTPENALHLTFLADKAEDTRHLSLSSSDPSWSDRLREAINA